MCEDLMRRILASLFGLLALASEVAAQPQPTGSACPYIAQGATLTPAQWNYCFQIKNDNLGYIPVNRAGDIMSGPLGLTASTSQQSSFNIPQGTAPSSPINGDIWTTSAGMFARINGVTVGPFIGSAGAANITIGSSPITGGTIGNVLYHQSGNVVGEYTITGTGNVVLSASPALTGTITYTGATLSGGTIASSTINNTNSATLLDGNFTLQNTADPTKQAVFSLAGISTGQTRTINVPDGTSSTAQNAALLTSNFLTAFNVVNGVFSRGQPAFTDIIGTVPYSQIQTVAASRLLGNPTGSPASVSEISLGTTLSFSGSTLNCTTATSSQIGCARPDNTTITIAAGVITAIGGTATSVVSGTTAVTSATAGNCLYNNNAVLGDQQCGYLGPRGRLTLVTNTPVLTSDQTAKSQIFYDCFNGGNLVYVWNGTQDVQLKIASCEISMTMATSGTGVTNSGGVFDVWSVNISGALTLCVATNGSGGGWASDTGGSNTARGTGYSQLDLTTRPYITNKNSITNCYTGSTQRGPVSVNQATYLGTIYTTAAGQTGMAFKPAGAAGGSNTFLGLSNGYNRVKVCTLVIDSNASWNVTSTSFQAMDAGAGSLFRMSYVDGLQQSTVEAHVGMAASNTGGNWQIGADLDSTSATPAVIGVVSTNTNPAWAFSDENFSPQIGFHFVQAVQKVSAGTGVYSGGAFSLLKVCLPM
jgi:hypothetical protein